MLNNFPTNLSLNQTMIIVGITLWSVIWKGLALWKAGRNNNPVIFTILLLLNTVGVADLVYLIYLYYKEKKGMASVTPPQA